MGHKKKILVVDNETDQLLIMERILNRLGHEPTVTDNTDQAILNLDNGRFDLVIIDLIMPEMDGTELCEQIKMDYPAVKVIAFSGHAGLYDPERLQRAGFDGVLGKPLRIDELGSAIEKVFN